MTGMIVLGAFFVALVVATILFSIKLKRDETRRWAEVNRPKLV